MTNSDTGGGAIVSAEPRQISIDSRPPPPPHPETWTVQYWRWNPKLECLTVDPTTWRAGWEHCQYIMRNSLYDADKTAQELYVEGHRNVRVIRVPAEHALSAGGEEEK